MNNLLKIRKKVFSDCESFGPQLKSWKRNGKTIVFTNGCFDLLHRGHVEYLAKAADKGDKLVIGLNSDLSVARLKGKNRPVADELSRALMLATFQFVAAVILFGEETPLKIIEKIHPDFLIKGNDYTPDEIAGSGFVMAYGGKVETIELVPGFSTSLLIEKIKKT